MADMLVELKTDEDKEAEEKGEMKDKGKDLPLKSGANDEDAMNKDAMDKDDKKKSYGSDSDSESKSDKSSKKKKKKKKLDEKEKSSLRKTLEKMMGK